LEYYLERGRDRETREGESETKQQNILLVI
jgi:hypothetical protein